MKKNLVFFHGLLVIITVELSPYKGYLGTRHRVLYIDVVLSLVVQNVLSRYEVLHLGPLNLSFINFGGFSYCVLYTEYPLREVPLYSNFTTCVYY